MVKQERAVTANVSIRSVGGLSSPRIYIEDVYPAVDAGRFPVKRIVGEPVEVWADIFATATPCWRRSCCGGAKRPTDGRAFPCGSHENDRWTASFTPTEVGRYVYAIEAWTDVFATWRRDLLAKRDAGMDVEAGDRGGPQSLAG